jgi:hypothetical protein
VFSFWRVSCYGIIDNLQIIPFKCISCYNFQIYLYVGLDLGTFIMSALSSTCLKFCLMFYDVKAKTILRVFSNKCKQSMINLKGFL